MKIFALFAAATALAGCAARGSLEERERSGLERELATRVAGAPVACIPRLQATALNPVDSRTIVYDAGRTLYVSRLAADCPSLGPDSRLIVETFGSSYCANDHIRAIEPGSTIPGPVCRLGEFTPYRSRR